MEVTALTIVLIETDVIINVRLCDSLEGLEPQVLHRAVNEAKADETTLVLKINSNLPCWVSFESSPRGTQEKPVLRYNLRMVYQYIFLYT